MIHIGLLTTMRAIAGQSLLRRCPAWCFSGQNARAPTIDRKAGVKVVDASALVRIARMMAGPEFRKTLNRAKHNITIPETVIRADDAIAPKLQSRAKTTDSEGVCP